MISSSKAIASPQRRVRVMSVKITGGTIALSGICANNFTVAKTGTGDYLLTPVIPFKQVPQVFATPETASIVCHLGTITASAIQLLTKNLSAAAADATFHVIIVGSDTPDQI